jgi:hypothetical protein
LARITRCFGAKHFRDRRCRDPRYDAPSLTAWDEMAAFLGITTLLHLLQPFVMA